MDEETKTEIKNLKKRLERVENILENLDVEDKLQKIKEWGVSPKIKEIEKIPFEDLQKEVSQFLEENKEKIKNRFVKSWNFVNYFLFEKYGIIKEEIPYEHPLKNIIQKLEIFIEPKLNEIEFGDRNTYEEREKELLQKEKTRGQELEKIEENTDEVIEKIVSWAITSGISCKITYDDIKDILKNEGYIKNKDIYGTKDLRHLWVKANVEFKEKRKLSKV